MKFSEFVKHCERYPLIRSNVFPFLSDKPNSLRRQVTEWLGKKWLIELKRGVYVVADTSRRCPVSPFFIANYLISPSYISLETALSFYQLIPERVEMITSISSKKTKRFATPLGNFTYRHILQTAYNGFVSKPDEHGREFYIACPEKALLDYLYLNAPQKIDLDYFELALRLQNIESLNLTKLLSLAKSYQQKKIIKQTHLLIQYIEENT